MEKIQQIRFFRKMREWTWFERREHGIQAETQSKGM